jgi:hypothetical protein
MKESLAFPYRYGLGFVQELLKKGGKDLAFAGALKNPPQNSRQIMNPAAYLAHEKLEPVVLPPMASLLSKDYERCDVGSVGQFDVMVLLKQFTNEKLADQISSEWRGGAYYAALKHEPAEPDPKAPEKDSAKAKPQKKDSAVPTTKSVALLYLSRWSSPDMAQKFAKAYAATLLDRYRFADPEQAEPKNEKEESETANAKTASAPAQPTHWMTDEGLVTIEQRADTVLVLESFDAKTQAELSKTVWETAAARVAKK